jgi:hypothetical protein
MKNLISFLLIFSLSAPVLASDNCLELLSSDHSRDSQSFQVADYQLEQDFDESPELYSIEALDGLLNKLGCEPSAKIESEVVCREIMPDNSYSRVCYVENELGYFFISKDMLDSVNIIYNRWD